MTELEPLTMKICMNIIDDWTLEHKFRDKVINWCLTSFLFRSKFIKYIRMINSLNQLDWNNF